MIGVIFFTSSVTLRDIAFASALDFAPAPAASLAPALAVAPFLAPAPALVLLLLLRLNPPNAN